MGRTTEWLTFAAILIALPFAWWRLDLLYVEDLRKEGRIEPRAASVELHANLSAKKPPAPGGNLADPLDAGAMRRAVQTVGGEPSMEPIIVENLTASDLHEMKEDYSCDLALTARQDCDAAYEDLDAHEMCLSLRQYFSYSRHCGYQP